MGCMSYHDQEDGDRYDECYGGYFVAYDAYELTPAAKKLVDSGIKIERCFYVTFG